MRTPLTRIGQGRYRHDRLGVEIEKTSMPDHPWELSGADPQGNGVALTRTLGGARAFLHEVEAHVDHEAASMAGRFLERLALGQAIRYEREQRSVSAVALASEIGVTAKRIEAIEAGRSEVNFEILMNLRRALELRADGLFTRAARLAAGDREPGPVPMSSQDAEAALLALHRYLYPERYKDVPTHVWDAGTIVEVADMLESALASHPDAHLAPR
jgi:transcriptional regulator with XRE-family HTH domain